MKGVQLRALVCMAVAATALWACVESAPEASGNGTNNSATTSNNTTGQSSNNLTTNNGGTSSSNNTAPSNSTSGSDWELDWATNRVALEVTPSGFESILSDFPALIRIDTGSLPSLDSSTVRFVDDSGDVLSHEMVDWNDLRALVWVKLPQVEAGATQKLWLYWGSLPGAEPVPNDEAAAWPPSFEAVFHMDDRAGLGANSVADGFNLSCVGDCGLRPGVVSGGLDASVGGLAATLPLALQAGPNEVLTVSAWYRRQAGSADFGGPLVFAESYCVGWQLALVMSTGKAYASFAADESVDPADPATYCDPAGRTDALADYPTDVSPHHVAMIINRREATIDVFVDGQPKASETIESAIESSDYTSYMPRFRIGTQEATETDDGWLSGAVVDEVMVTNSSDPNWIAAHYSNVVGWSDASVGDQIEEAP